MSQTINLTRSWREQRAFRSALTAEVRTYQNHGQSGWRVVSQIHGMSGGKSIDTEFKAVVAGLCERWLTDSNGVNGHGLRVF